MPTKAGTAYVEIHADFGPLNRQIGRMEVLSGRASRSFSRSMRGVVRDAEASRKQIARLSTAVAGIGPASAGSARQVVGSVRQIEASSERAVRALRRLDWAQRRVAAGGSSATGSAGAASSSRIAPGTASALNSVVSQAAVDAAFATAARRATARTGSLGGIATSGKSIAKAFAGNFAKGLAPGLAAAGLEHILGSALEGDMKSAGFEAGGALVGGLVGSLGGPAGAMLGAGIGSFAGDLGEKIFDDVFSSSKKLSPLQSRLKAESKHVAEAFNRQRAAARGLAQAYSNLHSSQQRQKNTTGAVHRAEQRLSRDRRKFGADSNRVRRDEVLLAQAKRRNANATREVNQVQRLSGASLRLYNHLTVVAAASTKLRIRDLRQEAQNLYKKWQQDKSNNDLARRAQQRYSELNREQKKLSGLYQEAGAKSGPKLQHTIEKLTLVQATYGTNLKGVSALQATLPRKTETTTEKTLKNWGHFTDVFKKRTAQPFKGDIRSMNTTANTGMLGTAQTANQMLAAMGVDTAQFHINKKGEVVQTKQSGGFIVPGSAAGDSYRTNLPVGSFILNRRATRAFGLQQGGQVPVMLEPGERAFMPHEVRQMGQGNLQALNAAVPRFQKGGLTEPQMVGPAGALRSIGQGAIHKVYEGAKEYLAKNRPGGIGVPGKAPKGFRELLKKWKPSHPRWDVWQVGLLLQKLGYAVSENPHFGGVQPVHTNGSYHYSGRAIDVNADSFPGGEPAALDKLYASLSRIPHTELLWRVADHYDHLHYAYRHGGPVQRLQGGGLVGKVGPILLRNGLDVESAAGILGNAWQESKWQTSSEGSGGGGLWGFTTSPVSLADMQAYASRRGMPWTSALAQTQFRLHHLSSSYRRQMNAMSSVEDTTAFFMHEWERPDEDLANLPERIRGAKKAFRILGGIEGGGGAGAATGGAKAEPKVKHQTGKYTKHKAGEASRGGGSYAEDVKAKYSVSTAKLQFGPPPQDLRECVKELRHLQERVLPEYQAAMRDAKAPEVKKAHAANVKRIRERIRELKNQRTKLLRKEAATKALGAISEAAEFQKWTKPRRGIFAQREDAYATALEAAEQSVDLEPTEPSNLTKDWVETKLKPHVENVESKRYGEVLGSEAEWRNAIIEAGQEATNRIGHWKERIESIKLHIAKIQEYRETKPQAWQNQKHLIPIFRSQIKALWKNVEKTNTETLPEWWEALDELQGRNRPRAIIPSSAFPADPDGTYGGTIFDTQKTIKELGLKIGSALENLGTPEKSERDELVEELVRQANQRTAVAEAQFDVFRDFDGTYPIGAFPPYAGKAHSGAVVPGPPNRERTMIVRGQERIRTPEQELAMAESARRLGSDAVPQLVVNGNIVQEPGDTRDPVEAIINDRRFPIAVRQVAMGGRVTPGGARS
jgi:hypothetical protein